MGACVDTFQGVPQDVIPGAQPTEEEGQRPEGEQVEAVPQKELGAAPQSAERGAAGESWAPTTTLLSPSHLQS